MYQYNPNVKYDPNQGTYSQQLSSIDFFKINSCWRPVRKPFQNRVSKYLQRVCFRRHISGKYQFMEQIPINSLAKTATFCCMMCNNRMWDIGRTFKAYYLNDK